jgi:hypothetical protein
MKKQSAQPLIEVTKVDRSRSLFSRIYDYFIHQIAPLYGDQKSSLAKIYDGSDRICELFQDSVSKEDLGLIVYKTTLSNDLADIGLYNTLEIKTLFVVNTKINSGRRIASTMLLRIAEYALSHSAQSIAVTVSSGKAESLAFFLCSGFKIKEIRENFYVYGLDEFFLFHPDSKSLVQCLRKKLLEKPSTSKSRQVAAISILKAARNQEFVNHHFESLKGSANKRSISGNKTQAFA